MATANDPLPNAKARAVARRDEALRFLARAKRRLSLAAAAAVALFAALGATSFAGRKSRPAARGHSAGTSEALSTTSTTTTESGSEPTAGEAPQPPPTPPAASGAAEPPVLSGGS